MATVGRTKVTVMDVATNQPSSLVQLTQTTREFRPFAREISTHNNDDAHGAAHSRAGSLRSDTLHARRRLFRRYVD